MAKTTSELNAFNAALEKLSKNIPGGEVWIELKHLQNANKEQMDNIENIISDPENGLLPRVGKIETSTHEANLKIGVIQSDLRETLNRVRALEGVSQRLDDVEEKTDNAHKFIEGNGIEGAKVLFTKLQAQIDKQNEFMSDMRSLLRWFLGIAGGAIVLAILSLVLK
jgi:hypothetical protein